MRIRNPGHDGWKSRNAPPWARNRLWSVDRRSGQRRPPRPPRFCDGADRTRRRRDHASHARRPAASVGMLGHELALAHHWNEAGDPAQSRRFAARRRLFGFAWPNDGVGTTYLSRLLGPRSERASTDCPRPGSAADHGRPLLGPWRSRNTGERSALERRSWSIMNSSHRSGRAAGLRCRCVTQPPSAPHPTEVRFEGWSRATTRKPAPKWAAPTQSRRLSASPNKKVIINVPGVIAE